MIKANLKGIIISVAFAAICSFVWAVVGAQTQSTAEFNLKQKNIVLPSPLKPIGNYVPAARTGNCQQQL
jgi:hypothetical protein